MEPDRLFASFRQHVLRPLLFYGGPKLLPLLPAENGLRRRLVERTCHVDLWSARDLYRANHGGDGSDETLQAIIERALAFNYVSWPRHVARYVQGLDVLDVGCGTGLHGIGYLVVGARSYTGVDPRVRLDIDKSKNLRTRKWEKFGWTPRALMAAMPGLELVPGTFETMAPERLFDLVVMHNTTEHLLELEEVLIGAAKRLRPGGRLLYNHHNYTGWNGHHQAPKTVAEIDPKDPEQQKFVDWAHLDFEPPEDHVIRRSLNRIRLDELKAMTRRHYEIDVWDEQRADLNHGAGRLTPMVKARHPGYSEREMLVHHVFCIARPKAGKDGKA
jgi:SAM-dependent methyltransferase